MVAARDVERAHAKAEKEAIIAEANQLKDSTAWGETSRRFNELMDRWKRAGRVGRSDDDALWAQFRKAADEFFNARQADRDQISTSEKENLAKKEELLKKAEALVPVADEAAAKKARQALGAIQDEWDQIAMCRATTCAVSKAVSTPSTSRSSRRGRRVEEDRSGGRRPQVQLRGAADRSARRA